MAYTGLSTVQAPAHGPAGYHGVIMRWTIIMRFALLICFAAVAFAQGTEPKPKAEDYDVHGQSKNVSLGAEFMVHSFSGQGQTFIAGDYLGVEVALYPPEGEALTVKPGAFTLRINGKNPPRLPQAPSMVAATLQRPEWQN